MAKRGAYFSWQRGHKRSIVMPRSDLYKVQKVYIKALARPALVQTDSGTKRKEIERRFGLIRDRVHQAD